MTVISHKYLLCGSVIKAVVRTSKGGREAKLRAGKTVFEDSFNICEPYDRKTHIFYIPADLLSGGEVLTLSLKRHKRLPFISRCSFEFSPVFEDENELIGEYDSGISIKKEEKETVADGVTYTRLTCEDKNSAPVIVFGFEIDTSKATLYTGTPDDGYKSVNVKAKVPEMIQSAVKNGVNVVAAVNADFFDMFGDCHPSGLCVKNGKAIANENTDRPFIGITVNGAPVITDLKENSDIVPELYQAVGGLEMILKDGELNDWGPLEPFSYVRHPRTAAGVTKDGRVILLVVDGRIPEYSNGATLVDLAKLMQSFGADRAINLDGGGSSIVYTKNGDEFELRNYPADLFRPRAKLIRKEFNALLVTKL
jgi:hypothetical protein